jgi:adenosylcobyric acid synthase
VLGICGGFQMLCRSIDDPVESRSGLVDAMGMLDADIVFAPDKVLRRWDASLHGYEIHHGWVARCAEAGWFEMDGSPQGYQRGRIFGTHWHGLFDNDDFRRRWLTDAAAAAGRDAFVVADDIDVSARRDSQLDVMADLLDAHLDVDAVIALLDDGPPSRPTVVAACEN